MKTYDIGLIGLAVMGENLVLNFESKGFHVATFDISNETMNRFKNGRAKGKHITTSIDLKDLVSKLCKPRIVMMMIRAGSPVDQVIDQLLPILDDGDIIIDGGNSNFTDTVRRTSKVEQAGKLFIGSGVSGGEEGALNGPSIMPGGSVKAWPYVKPLLQKIAAVTEESEVCCDWIGANGAGHFVKMVHNGIEYGDIQLITETYQIMKDYLQMSTDEIQATFEAWNHSELNSYLIEITAKIFSVKDDDGTALVEKILDTAGQKGTGKWTAINALMEGTPLSVIEESVNARFLSALKEERVVASNLYQKNITAYEGNKDIFLNHLKDALYVAKITSYAQGFTLLRQASKSYQWNLDFANISVLWKGGCIIRSIFLNKIRDAFTKNKELNNILLDDYFKQEMTKRVYGLRTVVSSAVLAGVPTPALNASIAYLDGYTTKRLPANLLQAQRDFFGAHTYERIDRKRGEFFHTNWTGKGGSTSSTTYNV